MTSAPTFQIPGYTIEKSLGVGGMARVCLAVQNSLNRRVAIKMLTLADPQFQERFLREGRIVARLNHRHIITVHDVGEYQGCYYMAMEYAEGGTLEPRIQHGLSVEQVLTILKQAASALDYAHQQGLVHRDIKPANILFRADGAAVVSDFGIAKDYQQDEHLTQTGWALGTPTYMSLEQALGQAVDSRSDLYSLGVMFYEMLTGEKPYQARDRLTLLTMHRDQPIPRLPGALARYQDVLDRLMAKKPEQRFTTAGQLLEELALLHPDSIVQTQGSAAKIVVSEGEWRARVEPDLKQGPGYAILVIDGLALPGRGVQFCLKRVGYGDDDLGPEGWRNGECWFDPLRIETPSERESRLILGPDIVQHMENGNYRIGLKAPGWSQPQQHGVNWRDIPATANKAGLRRRGRMGEKTAPAAISTASNAIDTLVSAVHGNTREEVTGLAESAAIPAKSPASQQLTAEVPAEKAPPSLQKNSPQLEKESQVLSPEVSPHPPLDLDKKIAPLPHQERQNNQSNKNINDDKKQNKKPQTLLLILCAVALLATAGGGGYYWWLHSAPTPVPSPVPPSASIPVPTPNTPPITPPSTPLFTVQTARQKLQENLTPDQLYALAQQFRAQPDGLQGALLLIQQAAEQNHPAAAFSLAEMYDPTRTEPTPLPRRRAAKAYQWYRQAAAGGIAEANARLSALRSWTEREAARGDAEAQMLLQDWQ